MIGRQKKRWINKVTDSAILESPEKARRARVLWGKTQIKLAAHKDSVLKGLFSNREEELEKQAQKAMHSKYNCCPRLLLCALLLLKHL